MRGPGVVIVVLAACRAATPAPPVVTEPAPASAPPTVVLTPADFVADGTCTVHNVLPSPAAIELEKRPPVQLTATYVGGRITRLVEYGSTTELTYDPHGRLLQTRDYDARSVYFAMAYSYFDGPGDPVIVKTWSLDVGLEYSAACTARLAERVLDCAGKGTSRETYDRDGRLLSSSDSSGRNTTVRTYDDVTRTIHETRDYDGDGVIDYDGFVARDAAGRVIRVWGRSSVDPGAGLVEFDHRTVHTLDERGRVKCRTTTSRPRKRGDDALCYEYDGRGNLLRETRTATGETATARYDGDFSNMRCGELARPRDEEHESWGVSALAWRAQIIDLMRAAPR